MRDLAEHTRPIQNLGLIDRLVRVGAGAAFIGYAVHDLMSGASMHWWHAMGIFAAVYLFMTGMLGYGPFFAMAGVKTCSLDGRNQCGSLPYELSVFLGRNTRACRSPHDRSLGNCRID